MPYFGGFGGGGIIGGIGVFAHVLDHGGNNDLGLVGGLLASAAWSLVIYRLALALRLPKETVDRYVAEVDAGPAGEGAQDAAGAGSPKRRTPGHPHRPARRHHVGGPAGSPVRRR